MSMFYNSDNGETNNVVGNTRFSDDSYGYKQEIKGAMEEYASASGSFTSAFQNIINSPDARAEFIGGLMESILLSPLGSNEVVQHLPFYDNYVQRTDQLMENTMRQIATESAMLGYAPIVTYNPFFLKKQWIECIFKDVLMTEVPKSPVINIAFEKQYLVDLDKNRYPLPESLYDDKIAKLLLDKSTGINISEDPIEISLFKPFLNVLTSTYFNGLVDGDLTAELTPDFHVCKVLVEDSEGTSHEIPVYVRTDITTHSFLDGKIHYEVKGDDGVVKEVIEDELIGNVDFQNGRVTLFSKMDKIKKVCLRGKLANRWNHRSLDIERKVERIHHTMPESGPRLNSAITIEEAADALALQNIDQVAYNADLMGRTLANLEDADIKSYLLNSFEAQEKAGVGPHGYQKLTEVGGFDALPYTGYSGRITEHMKDSREYFERLIGVTKDKLKCQDLVLVAVCHPDLVRFLQDGITWVFSDDTQISGVKLSYNFGVYTSAQDRVHIITSLRMQRENGIQIVAIPLTPDLITFKHYIYNVTIDRQYRNPMYQLVPNIMCTQRTLTFEVLPVQSRMDIAGRDLFSPQSLERKATSTP